MSSKILIGFCSISASINNKPSLIKANSFNLSKISLFIHLFPVLGLMMVKTMCAVDYCTLNCGETRNIACNNTLSSGVSGGIPIWNSS